MKHFLAFALLLGARGLLCAEESAPPVELPPCPPGWDQTKWKNLNHNTPKYVVGRIIAKYPHSPNGLRSALPEIAKAFPGSKITREYGDKVDIPCVGVIDLVVNSGGAELPDSGDAWAWQVVEGKCGQCSPPLCDPEPPVTDGSNVVVPNMLELVQKVKSANPEAFAKQADPKQCGDGVFLDKVVLALQAKDKANGKGLKFANNCKDGDCSNASKNAVAYYYGPDKPYEGAKNVIIFKVISRRCSANAAPNWDRLAPTVKGAWTNRGRDLIDDGGVVCTWSTARPCVDGLIIDVRTPNGSCKGQNPGTGFQFREGDWVRPLGPCGGSQ